MIDKPKQQGGGLGKALVNIGLGALTGGVSGAAMAGASELAGTDTPFGRALSVYNRGKNVVNGLVPQDPEDQMSAMQRYLASRGGF